ncbi:MAG: amidophosphoribosyltransferase [Deltaproteobacteria bacterium CG_4_8_14_3_um_filter_51_11]|nr:MAG: amidophosphoribosyltransferase [Deltaproteobacteria bacterium CG23_combo_of_CG06-09_8_20_14_all_51_20]PIX20532.1 MAG: amidophosphoribosyltransferase [Deltaproteobacteria bacterium CG_4_8_14_3_um_filter_51_11]PIY26574.1 MAG: amidophosphoribosyltransferase [Deltaproteobacteria bacterium CG_4_10_14_3_um_filter_51_14]PJB38736.1 MAG: amidophosphoribosyltransferase [Deltaproteobacteria bacterium CG_4_9_14_3_um_filter_51_14]
MGKDMPQKVGFKKAFLDLIFPPRCPLCDRFIDSKLSSYEGTDFCSECVSSFKPVTSPHCTVCWVPMKGNIDENHLCGACADNRPVYKEAAAPFIYEGLIADAIHQLKYGKKTHLAKSLGPFMASLAKTWITCKGGLITMPVPLHSKRLRERGFNQSLLLARQVAGALNLELDYLSLRRIRHTSPQMALGMKERHENVKEAFEVVAREKCKGRIILLIDDVATTGTTLNECAKALMAAGASEVFCLTLAKAAL